MHDPNEHLRRDFADSYAGRLRALVGDTLLKLPGAVVAILDDRGRVLLERSVHRDHFKLPGGLAEEGESLLGCARRESFEETGLLVQSLVPFGFCDDPALVSTLSNGHVLHNHTMMFLSRSFSGEPTVGVSEVVALEWAPLDDLAALGHPIGHSTNVHLDALRRFLLTGDFQLVSGA